MRKETHPTRNRRAPQTFDNSFINNFFLNIHTGNDQLSTISPTQIPIKMTFLTIREKSDMDLSLKLMGKGIIT